VENENSDSTEPAVSEVSALANLLVEELIKNKADICVKKCKSKFEIKTIYRRSYKHSKLIKILNTKANQHKLDKNVFKENSPYRVE
jgi:hypothetical protein